MGVKILKREYRDNFNANTTVAPDWLLGNTGDWKELTLRVEAGVDFVASQSEPLSLNREERTIKLMNGKTWGSYGFDPGQTVVLSFVQTLIDDNQNETNTPISFEIEIENIYNDTLVYAENFQMIEIPYETIPTDRANERVHSVKMYCDTDLQGLKVKYNHIENTEVQSHSLNSFIDGNQTEAVYVGLNSVNDEQFRDMNLIGLQSGMAIDSVKVRKILGESGDINATLNGNTDNKRIEVSANQYLRMAQSIPLTLSQGGLPFSNQISGYLPINPTDGGTYTNPGPNHAFIKNADFSGARVLHLRVNTKITNNDNGGNNRFVRLCLFRYVGNVFAEKTVLANYSAEPQFRGIVFAYDNLININIQAGESYTVGYEYQFENYGPTTRRVDFQVSNAFVEVYPISGFSGYKQIFDIKIKFLLASFWDDANDILNGLPPENLFNANSLTDVIDLKFFPEWNNPNLQIQNDLVQTERLGNTGWFNENFNGLPNNFVVTDFKYFDLGGAEQQSLSFGSETRFRARVAGVENLNTNSKFTYGFIWIPMIEEDYKNKNFPFHKNTKINSPKDNVFYLGQSNPFIFEGYADDGAKMNVKDVSFMQEGESVVFEAIFSPNEEFRQMFEELPSNRNFAIWISVADQELEDNFTDRTNILIDVNQMEFFIPISGELEGVTNRFLEHPESLENAGVEIYDGFLEDDVLARSFFSLKEGQRLSQIIMGYEVENTTTGQTYELERFNANLSQFITNNIGTQEINFNASRGFKLVEGNNKNFVNIFRKPQDDSEGKFSYELNFATKIRWEDWLPRPNNVPVDFFNSDLEFNGANNNWLNYLRAGGNHKINFFILFDVLENGTTSRYKNKFNISFAGYDENENITTTHKYIDTQTGTELDGGVDELTGAPIGILLANRNTRIEIFYKKETGVWDLENVYGVTTIEIDRGAGEMEQRQLSSIWGSEIDNLLIPLNGEEKLKIEQIAPNIIKTSCLVDYTKLTPADRYKITGRIGCFANNNGVPIFKKLFERLFETKFE